MDLFFVVLVTASMAAAFILLTGISPGETITALLAHQRQTSLEAELLNIRGLKKQNFIERQFSLAKTILEITERGNEYARYKRFSVLFAAIGAGVGAVLLNPFLAAVLLVAGLLGPMFAVQLSITSFQAESRETLYAAISTVTGSFDQLKDLPASVSANINHMGAPVQAVFQEFLRQCTIINPSVPRALTIVSGMIDSDNWREWCDTAQICIENPSKKEALREVVEKCNKQNQIHAELDMILRRPFRDMIKMACIVIGPVPFICFIFPDAVPVLFGTWQGKAALAVIAAAVLHGFYRAVHASRPLGKAVEV